MSHENAKQVIIGPRRGRSRRMSGQDTREQLLEAAAVMFARKGLNGVTLSEIAGAVGMSGPAIYNHFRSKDALFIEVVRQMYEEEILAFREALDPIDSVQEGLDTMFEMAVRLYREDGILQLLGLTAQLESVRNPELYGEILEASRRRDQVAIDLVRRAIRKGELPARVDAEALGSMMIALFVGGLGYRSLAFSSQEEFQRSVEAFRGLVELLRRGTVPASLAVGNS